MAIRRKPSKATTIVKSREEWFDYPEWAVVQSEIPIEEADAGIAAIDRGLLGPGGEPPLPPTAQGRGGSFAAAARAMREAEAAVHRSDWIVARETARATKFVDDTLRPPR
jgi:hypothetical protein